MQHEDDVSLLPYPHYSLSPLSLSLLPLSVCLVLYPLQPARQADFSLAARPLVSSFSPSRDAVVVVGKAATPSQRQSGRERGTRDEGERVSRCCSIEVLGGHRFALSFPSPLSLSTGSESTPGPAHDRAHSTAPLRPDTASPERQRRPLARPFPRDNRLSPSMNPLSFSLPLPAAFTKLNLESIGSPAPWTTTTSSLSSSCTGDFDDNGSGDDPFPAPLSLRHRVLLSALASLSVALSSASEQHTLLSSALDRAQPLYDQHRLAAAKAKEAVLSTSKAAQKAHGEAKRVEKLNGIFREGADRSVKALERKVVRILRRRARKGKRLEGQEEEEGEDDEEALVPLEFVEELIVDLDFDEKEVLEAARREAEDEGIELDDEWRAIEADLVKTMAGKVMEKKRPRRRSSACEEGGEKPGRLEGENNGSALDDAMSLPPTPPASIHSSNSSDVGDDEPSPASSTSSSPDLDALASSLAVSSLLPMVHPVLLLLFHLHRTISQRLSLAVDSFEHLVRASAAAVDAHRVASAKATKSGGRLRDLKDLERREMEEEERVLDELRTTTVELARLILRRPVEAELLAAAALAGE